MYCVYHASLFEAHSTPSVLLVVLVAVGALWQREHSTLLASSVAAHRASL